MFHHLGFVAGSSLAFRGPSEPKSSSPQNAHQVTQDPQLAGCAVFPASRLGYHGSAPSAVMCLAHSQEPSGGQIRGHGLSDNLVLSTSQKRLDTGLKGKQSGARPRRCQWTGRALKVAWWSDLQLTSRVTERVRPRTSGPGKDGDPTVKVGFLRTECHFPASQQKLLGQTIPRQGLSRINNHPF